MSNVFSNFLGGTAGSVIDGVINGSGNLRDYQHASRLYVNNNYQLAPKAGWIYYVVVNINPDVVKEFSGTAKGDFTTWYNLHKGNVGLLAKTVDLPKFNIQTETLNQYNKKTIIQKQLTYGSISLTFHDDMDNATTNLWNYYYQYYFADGAKSTISKGNATAIIPKYQNYSNKQGQLLVSRFNVEDNNRYGLNNNQTVPFFNSIDVYQLFKHKYTAFKIVNPIIKEWSHDNLDQTQGGRLLSSRMTVDYETVVYDTSSSNATTKSNPGFTNHHYDTTPSPLSIGGVGTNSITGANGLIAGASGILGDITNLRNGGGSPLDILNVAIKGANFVKNAKNVSSASLKAEAYSIANSTLGNISSTSAVVENPDGTTTRVPASDRITAGIGNTVAGIKAAFSPLGINFSKSSDATKANTVATQTQV